MTNEENQKNREKLDDRVKEILRQMSTAEKIRLCSGKDFWHTAEFPQYGIPSVMITDGPTGLRKQRADADMLGINEAVPTTCFPTAVTTGQSWDPDLLRRIGGAIGEEAKEEQVAAVLGPGVNIKRNPLCGRNFEYFSEDPLLAGRMGTAWVQGLEETGIGTSLKHFAANSQEYRRFSSDSQMDERTLRELYLAAFEMVVKEAAPATVMCAYPKLNGVYCSDNGKLLTDILRKEWGFQGMVVTDWGALNDRVKAFEAGCDLSMPGGSGYGEKEAEKAVRDGTLKEKDIDACAGRILQFVLKEEEVLRKAQGFRYDREQHRRIARQAAVEGAVLLKNEDAVLPLREGEKVLLVGAMASKMRYQGAGSSHIQPTQLVQAADVMKDCRYIPCCGEDGSVTEESLQNLHREASGADKVVVFAGLPDSCESEGFDRETLALPEGQNRMIRTAAAVNQNTVVVLMGGGVMLLPWLDQVKGVLYLGLAGQEGGQAAADLLTGRENPSGKLTETWPIRESDVPSYGYYAGRLTDAEYREGIYAGYRYYDKAGMEVQFPFGYGLSYTRFVYENLSVDGNEVHLRVRNAGTVKGAEVVQMYLGMPQDGVHRPLQELRAFQRVELMPEESAEVSFMLTDRMFAVWQDGWKVPAGTYEIRVGASSRDIRLRETIRREGARVEEPAALRGSWYEHPSGHPGREDWLALMRAESAATDRTNRAESEDAAKRGAEKLFTLNNTMVELADYSFLARFMVSMIRRKLAKDLGLSVQEAEQNPQFRMSFACSADCSLRGMVIDACGKFPIGLARAMVKQANRSRANRRKKHSRR